MPARRPNDRPRPLGRFERLEPRLPLAADITTGLVHHWTFDETSGDTAADSAGDSDGTLFNWTPTEPKWEPGRVGGALRFGTGDNYVLAPQQPASGSYSVSFWLNVAERNAIHPRILNARAGNTVYINNETNRGVSFSANETANTFSPSPPTFNAWEHYAVNFNAATGQGVIYRSGAPVATGAFIDTASLPNWTIGHHFDITNHDQSLRGALDDLRVYNRPLTDEDVAALASLGVPEPTHQEPIHHWTFDETTGFTANDTTGDADGTLFNWDQTEPRWEPGKVGGALRFSTVDNAVVTAPVSVGAKWSVAFWANVTARDSLFPRVVGPNDGRELWAYFNNENSAGGGFLSHEIGTFEASPPPLNTWQHYTFTYDTLADVGNIYRNGRLVASGVFHDNPVEQALVFGHNRDLVNHDASLNGLLDDLRVYDRLLSVSEIQTLAQVAVNDVYATNEDLLLDIASAQGLLANDTSAPPGSKTTVETAPVHGDLVLNEDGSFTYDPDNDYNGPDSFTYRLTDPQDNFTVATVALTIRPINDAPTFTKGSDLAATDEQYVVSGPRTITFGGLRGSKDALFQSAYIEQEFVVTPITGRWIEAHDPSHITGHPAPALYGDTQNATLQIARTDGALFSFAGFDLASWEFDFPATDPVQYTVTGLRSGQEVFSGTGEVATSDFESVRTPSAALIDTLRFAMKRLDSQAYILDNINLIIPPSVIIADWATNIAAGPPTTTDEAAQSLQFSVTSDREDLFHDQPTIDATGRLTFTPAPNVSGKAKITVTLRDSGGTAQGGVDASGSQTFEITVTKPHKYHNAANRLDSDTDLHITASDVIDVINTLNAFGSQPTSFFDEIGFPAGYVDVTRDNWLAPDDALEGINWLNAFGATLAPKFLGADTTTQGNWLSRYGADGYALNSGPSNLPAYATISFIDGLVYDYLNAASTTDPRALQTPDGSDRFAAEWTGDHGFTLDLDLKLNIFERRRVSFYMLDWQPAGRWQRLDILDGDSGELLDTRAIESFGNGVYLTYLLHGHVKIRFSNLANGLNNVLSGIFFDE